MIEGIFKTFIYILINNDHSPSEIFIVEHVFKSLGNINYKLVLEENLVNEKNALIIWDKTINVVNKNIFFNIKNIDKTNELNNSNEYIIMGICDDMSGVIKKLEEALNIKILEYENGEHILFDRI